MVKVNAVACWLQAGQEKNFRTALKRPGSTFLVLIALLYSLWFEFYIAQGFPFSQCNGSFFLVIGEEKNGVKTMTPAWQLIKTGIHIIFFTWGPIMCKLKGETPQEGINRRQS